jgi:hypothetical protein
MHKSGSPSLSQKELLSLLTRHSSQALQKMGKALGLSSLPTGRERQAAALLEQMQQPEAVQATLESLDEPDRSVLHLLQAMGGQCVPQVMHQVALSEGLIEPNPLPPLRMVGKPKPPPPAPPMNTLEQVVIRLQQHGLVLSPGEPRYGSQILDFGLRDTLIIPPPVLRALPPLPLPNVAYTDDTELTVLSGEASQIQRDLYLYWSAVRAMQVSLTTRGLVNKTQLKRINATLTHSENLDQARDEQQTGWLRFLRGILRSCQLVHADTAARELSIVPDSDSFFARPLAERTRAALDAYRQATFWNELARHPHIVIDDYREGNPTPAFVLAARETVLRLLSTIARDGWLDLRRILAHLRRTHYDFLLSRQPSRSMYISVPSTYRLVNPYAGYDNAVGWYFSSRTHRLDETNGWDVIEAGFVESMLREPLRWLGLVDLGTVADKSAPWGDRLTAIRLTPLGMHLLADAPLPENVEPAGGRLIVQPTFEVLAYPPVAETHLVLLDRIAERVQLDQVAAYRLTRESLYLAHEQHGLSVDEVIAALERESGSELPQNVAYTLQEWGRAQERVTLHNAVLLIQADAKTLDRLATWQPRNYRRKGEHDAAPSLLARRLTPTAALVPRDAREQVEAALFAMGNLPVSYSALLVQLAADEAAHIPAHHLQPRAWLVSTADGYLQFQPGAPRLFMRRHLRPFTVEDGDALRITEAQVQQAVQDGLPVERILDILRAWSNDYLPADLERAIKGWGGYYGSGAIERPLLLRLSDQRTLETLLADPELSGLLRPYQPRGILAELQPADLERVRALLAARGIDLTDPENPPD